MRIMQVVADGMPGGGTTCALQLVEDLLQRGHEVHFASQDESYAMRAAAELGGTVHAGLQFFKSRISGSIVSDLAKVIARVQPQVLHLHGGRAAFFATRSPFPATLGKAIYTVHGYHFTRRLLPMRMVAQWAEKYVARHVHETVFVCKYDQQLAYRLKLVTPKHPHRVIYNGVEHTLLNCPTPHVEPRRVCCIGRLTYQKDPHRVLDIATHLRHKGYTFDMIGGGELEAEIRQRVTAEGLHHVTVHGALPRTKTLELLCRANCFLLASRWEGLPIAPLEAMQAGVPVILSLVGGNPEVIEDQVSGFIVPQTDTEGYVRRIEQIADSPELADRLRQAARERIAKVFSRDRMFREYLEVYA